MFGGKKYGRLSRQILSFWNGYYETVRPMYLYTYDGIGPMVYKTNDFWCLVPSMLCMAQLKGFKIHYLFGFIS